MAGGRCRGVAGGSKVCNQVAELALEVAEWCRKVRGGVAGGCGGERNSEGSWEAAERCSEAAEGMAGGCREGSWRSLRGEERAVRVAGGRGGMQQGRTGVAGGRLTVQRGR
jgi:hypothetical protein